MIVREASFALRVVRRRSGDAGILYRRTLTAKHVERLTRIRAISPLAYSAALPLLRAAVRGSGGAAGAKLATGPYHALDADWGARVACYALVASGLRDGGRLARAAANLKDSDATEAAWWFAAMTRRDGRRAVRALRILTEATK
jgi:hypothetical protein